MRSHIAILKKKYLDLIIAGRKPLECRLTRIPCPPFDVIAPGEEVLLKESGGPVRARAVVKDVIFFQDLIPQAVAGIRRDYNHEILAADDFWDGRQDCRYCSLIRLKNVEEITPYRIKKKGLQAWIVCQDHEFPRH